MTGYVSLARYCENWLVLSTKELMKQTFLNWLKSAEIGSVILWTVGMTGSGAAGGGRELIEYIYTSFLIFS